MSGLFGLGRKKHENEAETTGTGTGVGTGSGTGTGTGMGSGNNTGMFCSAASYIDAGALDLAAATLQSGSDLWHGMLAVKGQNRF